MTPFRSLSRKTYSYPKNRIKLKKRAADEKVLKFVVKTVSLRGSSFVLKAMILFFSVTCFSVTVGGEDSGTKTHDAYVSSGLGDGRVLIPFLADDVTSSSICGLVYNGLTKIDKDLNVIADLAERWEVSDDAREIVFYLRKGVKWHDGRPFTAKDVKFTYDTILNPSTACPYVSGYSDITDVEEVDENTVKFVYKEPYAPALLKLGMGIVPEHLFSKEKDLRRSQYARKPIGTGPYKFVEWKSGEYMILEANDEYFVHTPRIRRYVYRIIPDQSVQFLELVTGGVDSMELNPYQFLYRSQTAEFNDTIEKYRYLSNSYTFVGYNLKDPILSDKRVRQALSYAINEKEIIDSVLLGQGETTTGPFMKDSPYYDHSARAYAYDMMKAAMLLREAGWSDIEGTGTLSKDGRELRIVIATNQGSQVREDAATVIQGQWAKLGIKTEIQVVAWSAFLNQFIDKRNFQAVILGWTVPPDPDIFAVWHSRSAGKGGLNFVSFSNERVDELIEKGRREFSGEVRKEIYREAHRLIAEEAPYTFLFTPYALPAVNRRIKGIEPAPAGIGYNFIDWHVNERDVKYRF
jgi:peptide/nickel transport system substrate-binding protein